MHIHEGSANSASQGGHFYDGSLATDPWAFIEYTSSPEGKGLWNFVGDDIKRADFASRVFVVHRKDGSRVACGILKEVA